MLHSYRSFVVLSRSRAIAALALLALGRALIACGDGGDTPEVEPPAGQGGSGPLLAGEAGAAGSAAPSGAGGVAGASGGMGSAGSGVAGEGGGAGSGPASRYVTSVESFTPGPGAGFGQEKMPDVVFGPPRGGGDVQGSLDVVSLGKGGEIVVGFSTNAVIDGPGVDFLVFENAFVVAGSDVVFRELGEVSVSEDGMNWVAFPCDTTKPTEGSCAGRSVVYANPDTGVSALDPSVAGGDPFDLALVGLARARFVRIRDLSKGPAVAPSTGFDFDALAIVNAESP